MKTNSYFDPVKYGRVIRSLRRDHNLRQDDIAEYLGVTRSAFSGIEIGKHGPSLNTFLGIYYFFKERGLLLTTDYLFGIADKFGRGVDQELIRVRRDLEICEREKTIISEQNEILKENILLLKKSGN